MHLIPDSEDILFYPCFNSELNPTKLMSAYIGYLIMINITRMSTFQILSNIQSLFHLLTCR